MKILLLISEYPPVGGGAGNASANIARLMVQMGNEVVVLTSRFGNLPISEMCDGVRILRGPSYRRYADRSTAMEQVSFIMGGFLRSLGVIREFKPDVILAFHGLPSGAIAWMLKVIASIPYAVSLRGGDVPGFRPYDFWLYHKFAVPWLHIIWHGASAVIANSNGLRNLALAFDPKIKVLVVPNGVDFLRFAKSDRDWSPPRILSVGRVVYQKGFDIALQALANLKDIQWAWVIAGDGPQLATLQTMIRENGLQDRVHFSGWLSTDQVKEQYAQANLFLFPSRHEGMPNAVLEAMASGLPVIASRIAGNEELVVDGETGMLVPAEDVEALRASLRELLDQATKREKMGQKARQRVQQFFEWKQVADQYLSILKKAMN
jgi:glycosyltransferase involved in cell wall biosynthesis